MKNNNKVTLSASPTKSFRRGVSAQKRVIKNDQKRITRKEAILKTSKYMAYTALATFIILNPKKAQAQSTPNSPGY